MLLFVGTDYAESWYFVHSWLRMESSADWYVDCYRYTLAFVIFPSIVLIFSFYIFYFVYLVYEFHFK